MNRLWVRLSLMIGGVLFFVFFLQFLSIQLDMRSNSQLPLQVLLVQIKMVLARKSPAEISRRLLEFMGLSLVIGAMGGIVIGRVVSRPINELVKAAHAVGQGDLTARAKVKGSRELVELATTFNQMADELQRTETLRQNLMADVSHELRTPLTILEGNLRAVLDHVYTLDEVEIANLYSQTQHLIRLVNDLRELSLAESQQLPMEMQPADLNLIISETLQSLEPLALEKGISLKYQAEELPELSMDSNRIRQVLFNLTTNAIRYTPEGGEISIKTSVQPGNVRVAVQDNGEGLEPDQLNAVFDRFYRSDKSRSRETGGTGLGLAIVKAIVEAHGGQVSASSQGKNLGSTFEFSLPIK